MQNNEIAFESAIGLNDLRIPHTLTPSHDMKTVRVAMTGVDYFLHIFFLSLYNSILSKDIYIYIYTYVFDMYQVTQ